MIEEAKKILPEKVQWINSLEEIEPITGCMLSNELLDNLAVHRVVMKEDGLKEIFVDHNSGFCEVLIPANKELQAYLQELCITLPIEHHAEINLQAAQWIQSVSSKLKKGFVMTIDYGYPAGELAEEHRKKGTLTCYYKHRVNEAPYQFIGEQDITAHVNFSALCLAGHRAGLDYSGFRDQCDFLLSLGFYESLKARAVPGKEYQDFFEEQTLTRILLYEMGRKFKVLIQRKGVKDTPLIGLTKR
jgi:SAM-dependent MidA family methyltransferase